MHNIRPAKIVVFGCGNILIGDDGFGPAVIAELQTMDDLPPDVILEDVGTGIREYLFDYILAPELAPKTLIILDAVEIENRRPGEVFTITPDTIPAKKIHDFSLHQFPTVNLLWELAEHTGSEVCIIAAQVEHIPDEISPGLTPTMERAVERASREVLKLAARTCERDNKETCI